MSVIIYQPPSLSLCSLLDAVSVFLSPPGVLVTANVTTTADTNPPSAVETTNSTPKQNRKFIILKISFIAVKTPKKTKTKQNKTH